MISAKKGKQKERKHDFNIIEDNFVQTLKLSLKINKIKDEKIYLMKKNINGVKIDLAPLEKRINNLERQRKFERQQVDSGIRNFRTQYHVV